MEAFFKSILEQDSAPVVICDLDHRILYMNMAACDDYARFGGKALLGKNLLDCHNPKSREAIQKVLTWFAKDTANNRVHTFFSEKENKDLYMVALRDDAGKLIGYYEKHECRTRDLTPFYEGVMK